uniref:Uncharacterized protein n=1 Tax=Anopheles atroparvus TaxID=41427 RepID=A0AAG5DS10_ANOAO
MVSKNQSSSHLKCQPLCCYWLMLIFAWNAEFKGTSGVLTIVRTDAGVALIFERRAGCAAETGRTGSDISLRQLNGGLPLFTVRKTSHQRADSSAL